MTFTSLIPYNYIQQLLLFSQLCWMRYVRPEKNCTGCTRGILWLGFRHLLGIELNHLMSASSPKSYCYGRPKQKYKLSSKIFLWVNRQFKALHPQKESHAFREQNVILLRKNQKTHWCARFCCCGPVGMIQRKSTEMLPRRQPHHHHYHQKPPVKDLP